MFRFYLAAVALLCTSSQAFSSQPEHDEGAKRAQRIAEKLGEAQELSLSDAEKTEDIEKRAAEVAGVTRPADEDQNGDMNLGSSYQVTGIKVGRRTFHRLTLTIKHGAFASGTITFDANSCAVNLFGDPTTCTEMFFHPIKVTLSKVAKEDPTGRKRSLYRIQANDLDVPIFLVVSPGKPDRFSLVICDERTQPVNVIDLR